MIKRDRRLMFSLISLIAFSIFISPEIHADENLDNQNELFYRTYNKEDSKFELANAEYNQAKIYNRQILVKTKSGSVFDSASYHVNSIKGYDNLKENDIEVVRVRENQNYEKILTKINKAEEVEYAEPDFKVEEENTQVPEDPLFNRQWYLKQIDLLEAWNTTQGSEDITIAVIDSGVEGSHVDLQGRVLKGFDFVDYIGSGNSDVLGHGTQVAGIIGANQNNAGVVGIDQKASILPIRAMGSGGTGSISGEIDSIYYAIDQKSDIINMSYVTSQSNEMENEALWDAYDAGIVLVAAAGNYSTDELMYPASYPQVISVSSTTKRDRLADFSNYGLGIDIAAPGKNIYSTSKNNGYSSEDGTSFSAPIISGIASLVKAVHPEWGPAEIRYAVEDGAVQLKGMDWDYKFGFGRADAHQAVVNELPDAEENAGSNSSSALSVKSGKRMKSKINLPMETGWYTFSLSKKDNITIDITNKSPHSDLLGVLYKKTKDGFKKVKLLDDYAMGEDEQLKKTLGKGEYFLSISDYYGRWSEDPYYIQIDYNDEENQKQSYSDVSFYQEEIEYLTDAKVITGFPSGKFKPDDDVKRLQAVSMILREKGIDASSYNAPDPGFKDVKPGGEGYEQIAAAYDLGIITGRPVSNTFDPWESLTRAQMSAIMARAYNFDGTSNVEFTDVKPNHWAYEQIDALVANGIIRGYPDNTFKPYHSLSRQHFAVMMYHKMNRNK